MAWNGGTIKARTEGRLILLRRLNRTAKSLELLRTISDLAQLLKAATTPPPFGPGFDSALVQQADRLEMWGTTEEAPEDYTEFRLLKNGSVVGVARIPGY